MNVRGLRPQLHGYIRPSLEPESRKFFQRLSKLGPSVHRVRHGDSCKSDCTRRILVLGVTTQAGQGRSRGVLEVILGQMLF